MTGQILGVSIYFGAALGLALALSLGLGLLLHLGTRIRNEPLPLIFFGIAIAFMAVPIATGRLITDGLMMSDVALEQFRSFFWVTRLITLGVLALCIERCLRFILRREWTSTHSWGLFWAFVVFGLSNQVLNAIFGAHPSFDHKALYAFILYFSFFLVAQSQPERCMHFARLTLLFFFVAGALTTVIMPVTVIEKGYTGGLPGLSFRYHGLSTHANTMGPLAIAFMLCLWRFPFTSRWLNFFSWFLVLISLILSQSKTSIAIAGLLGLFLVFYRYRTRLMQSYHGRHSGLMLGMTACACFSLSAIILATWISAESGERMVTQIDLATQGNLTSLTGRTTIWYLAWQEFLASPIFGYGPSIWGPAYRLSVGFWAATTAHNQLLQSLSSAGLVGAFGFIFYASVLSVYALRAAPRTDGISIALVSLMLIRSFTEVPFASTSSLQPEFFVHLLALIACVGFLPAKQVKPMRKLVEPAIPRGSARSYAYGNRMQNTLR